MSKNSFYQKQIYTVKAKSWLTINLATVANYFHINNTSNGTLYFAANGTPTPERYDLKISAGEARMHAEPHDTREVQVYNHGSQDANFVMMYFSSDFEPLVLAMACFEATGGGASAGEGGGAAFDGIIQGFDTPLPSGANVIGSVNITENGQLTSILNQLKAATPAGSNKIGSVDIANSTQLAAIVTALTTPEHGLFSSGNAAGTGTVVSATSGRKITCITFLSNDGEADLSVTVGSATFTLKSGEVLDNFKVYVDSVTILGNGVPYRMAYNEKGV